MYAWVSPIFAFNPKLLSFHKQSSRNCNLEFRMTISSECVRFFSTHKRKHEALRCSGMAKQVSELLCGIPVRVDSELCFYLCLATATDPKTFVSQYFHKLEWLLSHDVFHPQLLDKSTFSGSDFVVEVGPRYAPRRDH